MHTHKDKYDTKTEKTDLLRHWNTDWKTSNTSPTKPDELVHKSDKLS